MILVDANLLLYAEDSLSEHHETARNWWDTQLSGSEAVAFFDHRGWEVHGIDNNMRRDFFGPCTPGG